MRFYRSGLFSLLAFLLSVTLSAQSQQELLSKASKLYDANYNMDFDEIADLTYPKVVEKLGGREPFTQKLDLDYQNDKMRKRLQLTSPIFQVGTEKKIEGKTFCVILYRNPTRYFYEKKLDATEMQREVDNWKKIAATKEVYAEPQRNTINVKRVSRFVAVADENTSGQWQFFNFDDLDQVSAFDALFSTDLKKQLGL